MTYVNASVPKKSNAPGAPKPKNPTVLLVNVKHVTEDPERDAKGVLVTEDLALTGGANAIGIYATPSTISRAKTIEGDPDQEGIIDTITFVHPGNALELDEFIQNNLGEAFLIITRECGDSLGTRLHGSICNPLRFTLEGQDNNEGVINTFTFTQEQRSRFVAAHYRGAIPAIAPDGGGSDGEGI